MPDQVNRPHLIVVSSLIDGRSTSRRLLHIGYGRHFAGIGNAVKIPALPLVIADFSELVIHPLVGNREPQITGESGGHVGHERITRITGLDNASADVTGCVNTDLISTSEISQNRPEIRQDVTGDLVVSGVEVHGKIDMRRRDAQPLRRFTCRLGMSSTVRGRKVCQLSGVFLKDREELHAALGDAFQLARTNRLEIIGRRQAALPRLGQIPSHDLVSVGLQRCESRIGDFKTGIARHTRPVRITLGGKQAHPRGRIDGTVLWQPILPLKVRDLIGQTGVPAGSDDRRDAVTHQSHSRQPDPLRIIAGTIAGADGFETRLSPTTKIAGGLAGRKTFDGLKHLDERCVHFAPVQAIGRNDARTVTVLVVDLLLRLPNGVEAAIRFEQHELFHG